MRVPRRGRAFVGLAGLALAGLASAAAQAPIAVQLDGYAEYRHGDVLVVEGQRVRAGSGLRVKGAQGFAAIPLGYETKVSGVRASDGSVTAREIEARPNGLAIFEKDLRSAFDEREKQYLQRGHMVDQNDKGQAGNDYGRIHTDGRDVERVRRISGRMVPAYLRPEDFRVYVVENDEWNAMAAPNGSIYVFSGLLRDMDDDEVAIVLGHEMAHATHEHSRRQFKKQIFIQLAAAGVAGGLETIDDGGKRGALQAVAMIGTSAWSNGYGRAYEDQADRVGLRYAYEGGYAVERGPGLWMRFARKYGEGNQVANFFFSDHSQSVVRAKNLERELANNYRFAPR